MDDGTEEPNDAFLQAIKTNNEVFAAFRTHRMQNDIAKRMVDDKGELKSFSQFARDVRPYTDHQNRQWLRTEYNTAVIRAHQAADWKQFEAEKDVLPNLEWMPSTSPNPGKDHQTYWGTILPIDHPFWDQHRPGDRWNCKCSLRNTDVEPTPVPESGTGNDEPNRGLENNPGKDGKLFSDKHPYMPENCSSCPFGNGRLWALAAGRKKNCPDCKRLAKAQDTANDSSDITEKLKALHTAQGAEYTKTLENICKLKQFKPMPKMKDVYWVENSKDLDLNNLKDAAKKAVSFGNKVYILPNPGTTKSGDFIFVRKGIYKDYDLKTISGKSSVGNRMQESIGQTRRVLLNMGTDYNPRNLAKEIKAYFEANEDAAEVLIYKGKRQISINRDFSEGSNFIKNFMTIFQKRK